MEAVQVSQVSLPLIPTSPVRRKPVITYHSPSKELSNTRPYILKPAQRQQQRSAAASPKAGGLPSSPTPVSESTPSPERTPSPVSLKRRSKLRVPSWQDRLPLYHPLGRFAASLPPFDPTSVGLPIPPGKAEEYIASRLPPETTGEEGSTLNAGAQNEADGKPESGTSKRRSGGGGTKRKRKDPDDGDSAYPARRARGTGRNVTAQNHAADDDDVEIKESLRDMSEEPVERRQTRSRGPIKRLNSGMSDAPSTGSNVEKETKEGSSNHENEDEGTERTELGASNDDSVIAPA